MSDITILNTMTSCDMPAVQVINGLAKDKDEFDKILVLGFNRRGELTSRSNTSDVGVLLELMEHFKHNLLAGDYGGGDDY